MNSQYNESNVIGASLNSTDCRNCSSSSSSDGFSSALYPSLIFLTGILFTLLIFFYISRCASNDTNSTNFSARDTGENKIDEKANRDEMIKDALVIKAAEYHNFSDSFSTPNDDPPSHKYTFQQQVRCPACNHNEAETSSREIYENNDNVDVAIDISPNQEILYNERKPTSFPSLNDDEVDGRKSIIAGPYYCTICLECFEAGEEVAWSKYLSTCSHVFHPDCIASWLRHTSKKQGLVITKDSCPNCRGYFFKNPEAASTAATPATDQIERSHIDARQRRKVHALGLPRSEDLTGEAELGLPHLSVEENIRVESIFCVKHGLVLPTRTSGET